MASAGGYTQDLPPQGGYGPIDWAKRIPKRLNGYAVFGGFIAVTAASWTVFIHRRRIEKRHELEVNDARIAVFPLYEAERHRMIYCHFSAQDRLYLVASINCGGRTGKTLERTTDPREAVGKLSHIPILAETQYSNPCRHRLLRLHRQNRDEERELMKNVPGWELGTFYGEPVFHNLRDRFHHANLEELYAHCKWYDMYTKAFEKLEH